jgi:hypothetical protein
MSAVINRFYVHFNGAAVFVKTASYFLQQKKENPSWNTSAWHGPIEAEGIEHARMIGEQLVREGKLK